MNGNVYFLKCLTNLHVGNGEINFSVIDNEVQKDVVTGYPCIYSSSMKGAFRDYFEKITNVEKQNGENNVIENIFGSDVNSEKSKQGQLKFLQANIILQPVRASAGTYPFYYVTTKEMLSAFVNFCEVICGQQNEKLKKQVENLSPDKNYHYSNDDEQALDIITGIEFDENKTIIDTISNMFKENKKRIVIVTEDVFRDINLPVVARNKLNNEDKTSENLWYEEYVPHESIMYFGVVSSGSDLSDDALNEFNEHLFKTSPTIVQFGANASIGCGFCEIKKV